MSHLPSPGSPHFFASFPDGGGEARDVPTCLADTTEIDDPPDPIDGSVAEQKEGEACFFGPASYCGTQACGTPDDQCESDYWALPANACNSTVQAAYIASFSSSPPLQGCMAAMLPYLCSGTHKQQSWGNDANVIAHVYQSTDDATIADIYEACVEDYLDYYTTSTTTEEQAQCAGSLLGQIFQSHSCTSDATLDGDEP